VVVVASAQEKIKDQLQLQSGPNWLQSSSVASFFIWLQLDFGTLAITFWKREISSSQFMILLDTGWFGPMLTSNCLSLLAMFALALLFACVVSVVGVVED